MGTYFRSPTTGYNHNTAKAQTASTASATLLVVNDLKEWEWLKIQP